MVSSGNHFFFHIFCRGAKRGFVLSLSTLDNVDPDIQQLTKRISAIFQEDKRTDLMGIPAATPGVQPNGITRPGLNGPRKFLGFVRNTVGYAVVPARARASTDHCLRPRGQERIAELDPPASAWRCAGSELAARGLGGQALCGLS